MKSLFIGGIRSGKSKNAERYVLENSSKKPLYLATNEFFDKEMNLRIANHKEQRADNFSTQEEPLQLVNIVKSTDTHVLVECVSMWINNMLFHGFSEEQMNAELEALFELDQDITFVINDVSCSLVSEHSLAREFVDINGRISQLLASKCERVFQTIAGINVPIK